jgi:FkbM family methyltransferase
MSSLIRTLKVNGVELAAALGRLLKPLGLLPLARLIRARLSPFSPKNIHHRREMRRFYAQFIGKGDLAFDVGANMGNRTEAFLNLGARVISVEPQEACLERLSRAFGKNSRVIIVDKALGEIEGRSELMICDDAHTISTMSSRWVTEGRFSGEHTWTKKQEVAVTTLDALIRQYGVPKFCKIDVEGYELPVLKGLSRPVPVLSFEFAKEFLEDAKGCMEHLSLLGKADFNCSFGESMKLSFDNWMSADELYAKLESIDDKNLWGDVYARYLGLTGQD